jgi:serine/threonine protein kinase
MAPELWNDHEKYDGPPVDIFALGVILFMILTSKMPFEKSTDKDYVMLLKKPE